MALGNAVNATVQGLQSLNTSTGTWTGRTIIGSGGVTVTNGDGTSGNPTISLSGAGVTWTDVTTSIQALAINNGYVTDRSGGVAYTLPVTATLGDIIYIVGKLGIWTIAQNANQQITLGSVSSTVGVGGSLTATNVGDCVTLVCITSGTSTIWRILESIGNITVV